MRPSDNPHEAGLALSLGAAFDPSGHLSDVAIVMLADGQDLLPEEATVHVGTCDACCGRLAQAALLAVEVGELLREPAPVKVVTLAPIPAPAAAAPWRVVAAVFAMSLFGLVPTVERLPLAISRAVPALGHLGPLVAHGLRAAFGGPSRLPFVASLASSVLLIVSGFAVARWFRHEGVAS